LYLADELTSNELLLALLPTRADKTL
jgi:hypothetical protein